MRTRNEIEELEKGALAPYAMKSHESAGRMHTESDHPTRTCYQRDRDRIVHCEAFRKLEYKTQVFAIFEGDYYRTRLTHTIEVAQLARTIGRNLCLNEDLIEAIALAHDLGHPPFGHAGEDALNELLKDVNLKFNHNFRSYEIVTKFEKRYPDFEGLNLTREVLVGLLTHKTDYDTPERSEALGDEGDTLEAQVVDIADSLAYLNHDIDDGLTSGFITSDDLMESTLWQKAVERVQARDNSKDAEMFKYQIVKELIDCQARDLLEATHARLEKYNFQNSEQARACKDDVIAFSEGMKQERDHLQRILFVKLYHHYRVARMTTRAKRIIKTLFELYLQNPEQLPYTVYRRDTEYTQAELYNIICNYIASMTDRAAIDEYKKLFNPYQRV